MSELTVLFDAHRKNPHSNSFPFRRLAFTTLNFLPFAEYQNQHIWNCLLAKVFGTDNAKYALKALPKDVSYKYFIGGGVYARRCVERCTTQTFVASRVESSIPSESILFFAFFRFFLPFSCVFLSHRYLFYLSSTCFLLFFCQQCSGDCTDCTCIYMFLWYRCIN